MKKWDAITCIAATACGALAFIALFATVAYHDYLEHMVQIARMAK